MPLYKQTLKFEKEIVIEARDAAAANDKMADIIRDVEFGGDVRHDNDHFDFEDEPVECPACQGNCVVGEEEKNCERCQGQGSIPFEAKD